MKTLVIGAGEVGKALYEVVKPWHVTNIKDIQDLNFNTQFEVLQICYPDSDRFVEITKNYIQKYRPKLTIVNSSVKVGTTLELGEKVVYSPIRGRHPLLESEIKVYTKFVAGFNKEDVEEVAQYFSHCKLNVIQLDDPSSLEFCKLISNVHMGLEIAWRQEVKRMCQKLNINEGDYEAWERTYLKGYLELGQFQMIRSIMRPDTIGGHCIIPCTEILKEKIESKALDFILESNEQTKGVLNGIGRN